MTMVQWVFEVSGGFGSALAHGESSRLGISSVGGDIPRSYEVVRRMESMHLPFPLWLGSQVGAARENKAAAPPALHLRIAFAGGKAEAGPPFAKDARPAFVLSSMAEFCDVIADVFAAVELPLSTILPNAKASALDLVLTPLDRKNIQFVVDGLLLASCAFALAADARGFSITSVDLLSGNSEHPVRSSLVHHLLELTR